MKLSMPNRKGRVMLQTKSSLLALVVFSLLSTPSFASFDIFDEETEGYYGSGQTRPFRDAIENTDPLTPYDRAFLDSVEETRVTERWYARVMVGKSQVNIKTLTNNSSSFLDVYTLSTGSVKDNLYQLTLAGGHIWEQWAFELELLLSKKLSYSTNPVLIGLSPVLGTYSTNANIELNTYSIFVNAQYVIPRWFSFYPRRLQVHLDAGVGGSLKVSDVQGNVNNPVLNPTILPVSESVSARTTSFAGMLGAGARYQVSPCFLLGIAYRYYSLGKSSYGPVQGVKWQSNTLNSTGFFLDITYQF